AGAERSGLTDACRRARESFRFQDLDRAARESTTAPSHHRIAYTAVVVSLVHVDAFADRPFTGNPAAVCILERPADAALMQAFAAEMNLPATAFVWPHDGEYGLRWFTASAELALCGHGTLATAHALFERAGADTTQLTFHAAAGPLVARRAGELVELDFP